LGWPDVVAIEADVFPAERGNVDEQFIGQRFAFGAKLGDGVTEVDGVPEDDGGDSWAEFRPAEKEGEGSLGEKAVIPSGPPGRRSPFYQAFPIPFPFSLTVTYISSR
jgi:hypothetical protein